MNSKRTNPFRSLEKNNFPPLDDFFDPPKSNSRPSSAGSNPLCPDDSFCSRSSISVPCRDFSMDMSIGGRAAMAEHQHRIRKHGLDDDASTYDPVRKMSPSLSGSDDWGRIMDDTCSILSFSSSAFFNGQNDRSSEDVDTSVDASSSFFDKSVISTLLTPEKIRSARDGANSDVGVTVFRGLAHDTNESPDRSVGCCSTNVSNSHCSGVEEIFHAALRFHDEMQESILSAGESDSDGKNKSSSVSFAADTSFITNDGRSLARRKKSPECTTELNFLFGSPIQKQGNDDSFCVNSSFFGSPISPSLSGVVEKDFSYSLSSPPVRPCSKSSPFISQTTPLRSGRQVSVEDQSSLASFVDWNLVDAQLEGSNLTPKKKLFEREPVPVTIECTVTEESIELVRHTPKTSNHHNDSMEIISQQRKFGSNAEIRMNRLTSNADSPEKLIPRVVRKSNVLSLHTLEENVRGVRLCRASKLKSMGLTRDCSAPDLSGNVNHEDRSDF
ncbi:hypothetical protein HJC23_012709 [Cyclotella cryptica]|uniref:Uncharacterized protein n=1 Tax=Cyclotella cryptica TaxID=29204 RepID=A0ABD3PMP0_9STRA|eukprot:CCRYP_013359-RA/>CCRYP_013359-RA protein AED:0.41 eAED:0.41 QI:0/-1/0/1/-1/1/1/0/498